MGAYQLLGSTFLGWPPAQVYDYEYNEVYSIENNATQNSTEVHG